MSLSCLDNIVGLSESGCDCWDDQKPVDFATLNASSSGLYVSQPDTLPLRFTNSAADCENGGVWELLIAARKKAVRDTLQDFLNAVNDRKEQRFLPFTQIGDDHIKGAQSVRDDFAAAWIEPHCIRGGKLRVEAVDLAFHTGISGSTNVDIEIYSSLDFTTVLATATATVTANKQYFTATFSSPYEIDLGEIRTDLNERIYFVYEIPSGAIPVKNETQKGCNCSRRKKFIDNPYLQIMSSLGGQQAASVTDFEDSVTFSTSTMNGMVIKAQLECDYYSWLCELSQKPNEFSNTLDGQRLNLGGALADAIQAKSVYNLANSLLVSRRVNYYSMINDTKQLYAIKGHWIKIYKLAIENLVYHMPADVSDCLKCANKKTLKKGMIKTKN